MFKGTMLEGIRKNLFNTEISPVLTKFLWVGSHSVKPENVLRVLKVTHVIYMFLTNVKFFLTEFYFVFERLFGLTNLLA